MLASPEYIACVVKLAQHGLFGDLATGAHVIRGYADLGHEEFILVGPSRLISLYTGTQSSLPEGHEHFFTRVPTLEELTDVIARRNFDICEILFKDLRTWCLSAAHIESKQVLLSEHKEFACALATLLLKIIEHSPVK